MDIMDIINLTPHTLTIYNADGEHVLTVPPSGTVARVAVRRIETGVINGVPLYATQYGAPEGLPEPLPGVIYVVSGMMRAAVPERTDVWQPGELRRDENGQVVGCVGLQR